MDIVAEPLKKYQKKVRPPAGDLAKDYFAWLSPMICPTGYGWKYNDAPVRKLSWKIEQPMNGIRGYPSVFSVRMLQEHLSRTKKYYFVGTAGTQQEARTHTLVKLDIDCHDDEPDAEKFARWLVANYFPDAFHQLSGGGWHIYLLVRLDGRNGEAVNRVYKQVEKFLNEVVPDSGCHIGKAEVKGTCQHVLSSEQAARKKKWAYPFPKPDRAWTYLYRGDLGKVPDVRDFDELELLKGTCCKSVEELEVLCSAVKSSLHHSSPQNTLSGNYSCKSMRIGDLTPKKTSSEHCTSVRMKATWDCTRQNGTEPTTDEVLEYIRTNGLFSPPWSYHEAERRLDVEGCIAKVAALYDPARASAKSKIPATSYDYDSFAKELLSGGTIPYGKKGKADWRDISVFLSCLDVAIVADPNGDGSVPYARLEKLWQRVGRRKGLDVAWDNKKYRAMRELLFSLNVLNSVSKKIATYKAFRYTLGPEHPLFATTQRVIVRNPSDPFVYDAEKQLEELFARRETA